MKPNLLVNNHEFTRILESARIRASPRRTYRFVCVFQASALSTPCLWLTVLSRGKVASVIAVNGDSICRHDFLQPALLSVIIT